MIHRSPPLPDARRLQGFKRTLIERHVRPENYRGLARVLTTLVPLATLWYLAVASVAQSYWLSAGCIALMSLFLLRAFVLMHECGHGSLFRTPLFNKACGFLFGIVSGMPQYVWSQHHKHHHSTNGNWAKYRGPLNIISIAEYAAMTPPQQRRYRYARNIWLAPLAGFLYFIVNPRLTWLRGSVGLVRHVIRNKIAQPGKSIRTHALEFETRYWSSALEYRHMLWNNLVLLSAWALMAWAVGPMLFVLCYVVGVSLAGGAGILLFTVQHNFEHSYASGDKDWDFTTAALEGTSFLELPRWLNWFTADIGYHHIHHLSARIPSYCLKACHNENQHLFRTVPRIRLTQIPRACLHILWDVEARRIVSAAEYQRRSLA